MFNAQLEQALLSCAAAVLITEPLCPEEISGIIHGILLRHPEMFWFQGKWQLKKEQTEDYIVPVYSFSSTEARHVTSLLPDITAPLIATDGTASERAQKIFENLTRWSIYGAGTCGGQTVYDAFIDRAAYCKGLSKAYQLLLNTCGIPCRLAEGTLYGRYRHVWNEISPEGQWICADVSTAYPVVRQQLNLSSPVFGVIPEKLPLIYHKEMKL